MTKRRIRIKDDSIEVNVDGQVYRPVAVAINGGQVLVRPDSEGLVIETDSFIHMELRSARGDPVTGETRHLPNGSV